MKTLAALLLPALLFIVSTPALSADALVKFTQPTTYTDGSPLPQTEIKQFTVETAPVIGGPWTLGATVPNTATEARISALALGPRCFRAFTTDTQNRLSGASNVICATVKQPSAITITVSIEYTATIAPAAKPPGT